MIWLAAMSHTQPHMIEEQAAQFSNNASEELSVAELPTYLAEQIALLLATDGTSLLGLDQTNKFWHQVISRQELWQVLLSRRCGPDVLPAGLQLPVAIAGWVFYPGMDASGGDATHLTSLDTLQLAAAADAHEGAQIQAFTTEGQLKHALKPHRHWEFRSYEPGVGLYVREAVVLQRNFPLPLPVEQLPVDMPAFPGWTFFPGVESPGADILDEPSQSDDYMSACGSLQALAQEASAQHNCVAFTTTGKLKQDITDQSRWRSMGRTWHGMWVRDDVVAERGLQPAQASSVYKHLYFQHTSLRKYVAFDCGMAWLGSQYITRHHHPLAAAPHGQLAVLHSVCWLDINAIFRGVLPGSYNAVWRMMLHSNCTAYSDTTLSATIIARRPTKQPYAVLPAEGMGELADVPLVQESVTVPVFELNLSSQKLRQLQGRYNTEMFDLCSSAEWPAEAGIINLPPGYVYDLHVQFKNINGDWKQGISWDYVELRKTG